MYFGLQMLYPFWCGQPVYHPYEFWRKFSSKPHIINTSVRTTKINSQYYKPSWIITKRFTDWEEKDKYNVLDFLQKYFITDENGFFYMNYSQFKQIHSNNESWMTIYFSPHTEGFMYGILTTRKIHLIIQSGAADHYKKHFFPIFYWDNCCIYRDKTEKEKQTIIHELIYTHEITRKMETKYDSYIPISLFQKIGDCKGIVPFLKTKVSLFDIQNKFIKPPFLYKKNPDYTFLHEISSSDNGSIGGGGVNITKLYSIISEFSSNCKILIDKDNWKIWNNEKIIRAFVLEYKMKTIAIFVFKNKFTYLDNENRSVYELCLSLFLGNKKNKTTFDLFIWGFLMSVKYLFVASNSTKKIIPPSFNYSFIISIDDTSHNLLLKTELIEKKIPIIVEYELNTYLYNLFCPTVEAKNTLLMY